MAHKIEIELTDLEARVWSMFVKSPQWAAETFARHEVWRCMEQVYQEELERLMNDPDVDTIPASRDAIIALSTRRSAAERDAELIERLTTEASPISPAATE